MTDKELKRMNRSELLQLLVAQIEECNSLKDQLAAVKNEIDDRKIAIDEAGSIAEAALRVNSVFDAAQAAAEQYLDNIRRLSDEQEERCKKIEGEATSKAELTLSDAEAKANNLITDAETKAKELVTNAEKKAETLVTDAQTKADKIIADADKYSKDNRDEADAYYESMSNKIEDLLYNLDKSRKSNKISTLETNENDA